MPAAARIDFRSAVTSPNRKPMDLSEIRFHKTVREMRTDTATPIDARGDVPARNEGQAGDVEPAQTGDCPFCPATNC